MPAKPLAMGRPRAVLCDIDGCLYDWTAPLDHAAFARIRALLAGLDPAPPFSLMTGRSVEFVKAMAAALGLDARPSPHLCELGALILDGTGPDVTIHPLVQAYGPERLRRDRIAMMELVAAQLAPAAFEPSRDFTLNVVTAAGEVAARKKTEIEAIIGPHFPEARVLDSGAVVDVALVPLSKSTGLAYLTASRPGWEPAGVLAIGDSENDLDVLRVTGFSAAPANAAASVRETVDYVSPLPGVHGVLDILAHFLG